MEIAFKDPLDRFADEIQNIKHDLDDIRIGLDDKLSEVVTTINRLNKLKEEMENDEDDSILN